MSKRYIAKIVLFEDGMDEPVATKSVRLYSDELERSVFEFRIKVFELMRDLQFHASDGKIDPKEYYGRPNYWGLQA